MMRRHVFVLLFLFLVPLVAGCRRHAATPAECREILDRIVVLELGELGFRDEALARRKAAELEGSLAEQLRRCQGVRIDDGAMGCVRGARNVEEISHRCLR